jgi:Protein involved in formate dehydrogenase formation
MMRDRWDTRIHRAIELASVYPFAAEGLGFYSQLATFQRSLYTHIEKVLTDGPKALSEALRDDLDLFLLLPKFSPFLAVIEQIAPLPLRRTAASLAQQGPARWRQLIGNFWQYEGSREGSGNNGTPSESLLAWTFLQPYAEYLAGRRGPVKQDGTPLTCPLCGARPIVGVLRSEGDGAKKSLVCMLCAHEWAFRRIYCPACGEEREPQMAFYSAPEIAHVRVDVCDTCHTYLKSIDLTKTGLAVPIVDELATIPLDLWAREHGYEKLQTNLLGT